MKIALATDWFPPRRGGIESQLGQLSAGLARRGHAVDVITSTPGASDAQGYHVRGIAQHAIPWLHLALKPGVVDAIERELNRGYDVVHAHVSVVSPVGYLAAHVAQRLGLPTVVTFHSVLRHKRALLNFADGVVGLSSSPVVWTAVSSLVAGQVGAALGGIPVQVLPNGIDFGFWRAAPRERRTHAADAEFTLVSAMRLHRKKRPHALVEAFARAAGRTGRRAVLVLLGDGPERAALERSAPSLGVDGASVRLDIRGWVSGDAVRSAYATADCFALASVHEAFGIAALEAAASGLPVIGMRAGGAGDFVTDGLNGHLCSDDADLSRAIAREMMDPLPQAATDGLARYDWPVVLTSHEAAYARAVSAASVLR